MRFFQLFSLSILLVLQGHVCLCQTIQTSLYTSSFDTVQQCSPIQVTIVPSDDLFQVDLIGDSDIVDKINVYVKDGTLNVENTGIFGTESPVGVRVTMPASALKSIINKGQGGSSSLTALSGFSGGSISVQTGQFTGPTTLGLVNGSSNLKILHASNAFLNVTGSMGSVELVTLQGSGDVVLNQVSTSADLLTQSSTGTVYIGGLQGLAISGNASNGVTYSNGTCDLV